MTHSSVTQAASPTGHRVRLLGVDFDTETLSQTVERVRDAALTRRPLFLSTANVNFVVAAARNAAFHRSLVASDLCVPDGSPIVWFAKLVGLPLRERVAGADVFEALRASTGTPINVYFFGGPEGAAARAGAVLNDENGGVRCVGYAYPGFGDVDSMSTDALLEQINAARPDFVVVALGAVKGQAWIMRNRGRLSAPVVSHLGAVVNFVAGDVQRAPRWVRRIGLEWLWRIRSEPSLFTRYAKDGIRLAVLVISDLRGRLLR